MRRATQPYLTAGLVRREAFMAETQSRNVQNDLRGPCLDATRKRNRQWKRRKHNKKGRNAEWGGEDRLIIFLFFPSPDSSRKTVGLTPRRFHHAGGRRSQATKSLAIIRTFQHVRSTLGGSGSIAGPPWWGFLSGRYRRDTGEVQGRYRGGTGAVCAGGGEQGLVRMPFLARSIPFGPNSSRYLPRYVYIEQQSSSEIVLTELFHLSSPFCAWCVNTAPYRCRRGTWVRKVAI